MRRWRSAIVAVSGLMLIALLVSCSTPGQSGTQKVTVPPPPTIYGDKTPEYGGKVSFAVGQTGGFDPANALALGPSVQICYESLVCEDWTKGPTGSGITLMASNYTPPEYFGGWLASSWQITDLKTITYYLRQGVHFQKKPPVNGRELTADDVVSSFGYYQTAPRSSWYRSALIVKAIDKYTVQFVLPEENAYILQTAYSNLFIIPREVVDMFVDLTDWHTMNTTGPYYVKNVIPDTSVTYARNTDYWQTDPFRPKNRLPYIDEIEALVITDTSLQTAALRSGRIVRLALTKSQADNVMKTNPELEYRRIPPTLTNIIHMRTDIKTGPFASVQVRQALSMAIDREQILRDYFLDDAVMLNWPFQVSVGPQLYTPLDQLPDNLKELYEYHPDRALELLSEAGYPSGFKATINLLPNYAGGIELYSMVKEYFDAIGVETTLTIAETSGYFTSLIRHTYTDMSVSAWGNAHPIGALAANICGALYNYSVVCDSHIDEERRAINSIPDDTARSARLKQLGLYLIEQQYYIELPSPYSYIFWQPWLLGQSGEVVHGSLNNWYGYLKFAWVDSKLKSNQSGSK